MIRMIMIEYANVDDYFKYHVEEMKQKSEVSWTTVVVSLSVVLYL